MRMRPRDRWRMRPGQTWQRVRNGGNGMYHYFEDPVTLLEKVPRSGGKRWLVACLTTGAVSEERFTTRDSWRFVA